jgi:hypothetical protein
MNVTDRPSQPPLSPKEEWISDGRQVLHFQPRRYDRWSQSLEVTLGELIPRETAPLLKRRKELTREQAIKLWMEKRQKAGGPVRRSGARHNRCGSEHHTARTAARRQGGF